MRYAPLPIAGHSAVPVPREVRLRRSGPREECLTSAMQYAATLIRQNRAADGQIEETAHIKVETWLSDQLLLKGLDEVWDVHHLFCTQYLVPCHIGLFVRIPVLQFNENILVRL